MGLIILLVVLDLSIKSIIYFNFMEVNKRALDGWIGFVPLVNRSQASMFNLELNMDISTEKLILINVFIVILLITIYWRIFKIELINMHIKIIFTLFISAGICSVLDKIILGGSLDFILIKNRIFDLKDIYLFMALIYMTICAIKSLDTKPGSYKNDILIMKKIFGIVRE